MSNVVLYTEEKSCCGCGGCMNVCPKNAIAMVKNADGFAYPQIDEDKCVSCGLCKKVCAYNTDGLLNEPLQAYVAATQNTDILKSASGGAFASIAKGVLEAGGRVYGSVMRKTESGLKALHIGIDSLDELVLLQGSKYVQSDLGNIYSEIKSLLPSGRQILFSGTPCQVAGLKAFLGKEYENLITIDIICHGVPSGDFFSDYIATLEKKLGGEITDFVFRDKTKGWEYVGRVDLKTKNGKLKSKKFYSRESSYYYLFLTCTTCRESCYSCKYATKARSGDITIGDYWGVERMHPEYLSDFDIKKGISCVLVNTEKGQKAIGAYGTGLKLAKSDFEKVLKENEQLSSPSRRSDMRDAVLTAYRNEGYEGVEKWFNKRFGSRMVIIKLINRMPKFVKQILKKIRG